MPQLGSSLIQQKIHERIAIIMPVLHSVQFECSSWKAETDLTKMQLVKSAAPFLLTKLDSRLLIKRCSPYPRKLWVRLELRKILKAVRTSELCFTNGRCWVGNPKKKKTKKRKENEYMTQFPDKLQHRKLTLAGKGCSFWLMLQCTKWLLPCMIGYWRFSTLWERSF